MKYFIKLVSFVFLACSGCVQASPDFKDQDPYRVGTKGLAFYEEGEHKEASLHLKYALDQGQNVFAGAYADICKRELDGEKHKTSEAAHFYLLAADSGDADIYSYLQSVDPQLVCDKLEVSQRIQLLKTAWRSEERDYNANYGYKLWLKNEHLQASRYLKRASQAHHALAQEMYADVCARSLDGKFHFKTEAAMYYYLAALGGCPDSFSYLNTLGLNIDWGERKPEIINNIVEIWVLEETLYAQQATRPSFVNNYLINVRGLKINKTSSQKIPYFIDQVARILMRRLGAGGDSILDEMSVPSSEQEMKKDKKEKKEASLEHPPLKKTTCREDVSSFVDGVTAPYQYGIVYPSYLKDLEVDEEGHMIPGKQHPSSVLIKFLLDVAVPHIKEISATKWSKEFSHYEYPWIEAGIKYWKQKYKKPFNKTSLSEDELMRRLKEFEPIEERDLRNILDHIEPEEIWPNGEKRRAHHHAPGEWVEDPIVKEFQEQLPKYLASPLAGKNPFVEAVVADFLDKIKAHALSPTEDKDKYTETLKTPILMHLCEHLVLKDIQPDRYFLKLFQDHAAPWFTYLKILEIHFAKKPKETDEILKVLKKIAKRGVEVKYFN